MFVYVPVHTSATAFLHWAWITCLKHGDLWHVHSHRVTLFLGEQGTVLYWDASGFSVHRIGLASLTGRPRQRSGQVSGDVQGDLRCPRCFFLATSQTSVWLAYPLRDWAWHLNGIAAEDRDKNWLEGWRDGSVVKTSSRGPEFNSLQLHGGSQPSVMGYDVLFWCVWRQWQCTHINKQTNKQIEEHLLLSRGLRFNSQHPHASSQPNPRSRELMLPSGLYWHQGIDIHVVHRHTYRQNTCIHKVINISLTEDLKIKTVITTRWTLMIFWAQL